MGPSSYRQQRIDQHVVPDKIEGRVTLLTNSLRAHEVYRLQLRKDG